MDKIFTLGTRWVSANEHRVRITAIFPSNLLIEGYSYAAGTPGVKGLWHATTGAAFDAVAKELGNLIVEEQSRDAFAAPQSANPIFKDISELDRANGGVSIRLLFSTPGWPTVDLSDLLASFGAGKVGVQPGNTEAFAQDAATLAAEMLVSLGWRFDGTTWLGDGEALAPLTGDPVVFRDTGEHMSATLENTDVEGYESLREALEAAYDQAARGKGKERHANDLPFDEQPINVINGMLGSTHGYLYQVMKKAQESKGLPRERAMAELLGVIVYAAGAWMHLKKGGAQ